MRAVAAIRTVVLLIGLLLSPACAPPTACDRDACPSGLVCHAVQRRCVVDEAPRIVITEPTPAALVPGDAVMLRGVISDESDAVVGEVRLSPSPQWTRLSLAEAGLFEHRLPLPSLDNRLVTVTIRATDPGGKSTERTLQFFVDNLAPTASFAVVRASGRVPTEAVVSFSEPLAPGGALTFTPPATGTWNATRDAYLVSLAPSTAYTLAVNPPGSLRDEAGNSLTTLPTTFVTEAAAPPSGRLRLTAGDGSGPIGAVSTFSAASDADGVITLAFTYGTRLQWGRFSPHTGDFEVFQDIPVAGLAGFRVHALMPRWDRLDLRTSVLVTWTTDATPVFRATAKVEGRPLDGSAKNARAVLPGTPCDPAAPSALGFILDNHSGSAVVRVPLVPDQPLTLRETPLLAHASPERWDVLNPEGTQLLQERFRCAACPASSCRLEARRVAIDNIGGTSAPAVAATRDGRYVVALADISGGRAEVCMDCTTSPCTSQTATRSSVGRRVSVGGGPNQLIAAQKTGDIIGLQVFARSFSGCSEDATNQWTLIDSVPASGGVAVDRFQPVMVGSRPGVLFQLPSNELHVYSAR